MSKEHELPSDSDDDDEDYVPGGIDSDVVSEVESEGEIESGQDDENNESIKENKSKLSKGKGKKRRSGKTKTGIGKKRSKNVEDEGIEGIKKSSEDIETEKKLSEEEEKKRADSLWADFMKDTPAVSKPKSESTANGTKEEKESRESKFKPKESQEKVKITKLFEFAGEEVRVEKEVAADSAEARLTLPSSTDMKQDPINSSSGSGRGGRSGIRKVGLGGISSVLGQLGKKAKISVLEKSKLDWDSYKKEENIEEEITTHNKGKGGYLEKQDFLQRADLRQFEIEKQLRTTRRSNR